MIGTDNPRSLAVHASGVFFVCALALTAGCSMALNETKESREIAAQTQFKEAMQAAEDAYKQGEPADALVQLEKAAKIDPGKKQPWMRMAQMHFDARNYGSAIIAAQEVQLRDNSDITAKTIIAASGLRVAAKAVEQLRASNVMVTDTINEARTMSRTMRDVLGEPLLPPATEVDLAGQPVRVPPSRTWSGGTSPRPVSPSTAARPTPPATQAPVAARSVPPAAQPAPSRPSTGRNPFDILTKE